MNGLKKYINYFFKGLSTINIIIPVATLIFVCIVSYKALTYKSKIDTYEEYFTIIDHKDTDTVYLGYDNDIVSNKYKDIEINEYINCLNKKLTTEELTDEIKLSIRTLENLYNQSYNYFSFKYTDIYTGFTISYNDKQEIFAASTIKAPMAMYVYEQAEQGLIDLNEQLTYTSFYYNTGSGILKNRKFNQNYTVRELISYAIIHSDNAAHNMLMDRYGRANMYNFWNAKGTSSIFKQYSNWGVINANDATIYLKELYDYYNTDTELSNELMKNFTDVVFKPLSNKDGKKNTANKAGWSGSAFHDTAIIFDDNPYILVVLSNVGYSTYLFDLTSEVIGNIHTKYWDLKYDMCNQIISR